MYYSSQDLDQFCYTRLNERDREREREETKQLIITHPAALGEGLSLTG